jgi:hypothetical protein
MKTDSAPTVTQARTPPEPIRSLTTLGRPDYVDLFTVTAAGASDTPAEQWARTALESASATGRFVIWQILCGLRLDARPSPDRVAGWRIADRREGWIRLEAASWFMTAEIVVFVEDEAVTAALFIRYDRRAGVLVWTPLSVAHRALMPGLLQHAVRRMNRGSR